MPVTVNPTGRLTVTVKVPLEAVDPVLLMVSCISPFVPRIHGGSVTELAMDKSVPVKNAVFTP
jgi:hypothetical protein